MPLPIVVVEAVEGQSACLLGVGRPKQLPQIFREEVDLSLRLIPSAGFLLAAAAAAEIAGKKAKGDLRGKTAARHGRNFVMRRRVNVFLPRENATYIPVFNCS